MPSKRGNGRDMLASIALVLFGMGYLAMLVVWNEADSSILGGAILGLAGAFGLGLLASRLLK